MKLQQLNNQQHFGANKFGIHPMLSRFLPDSSCAVKSAIKQLINEGNGDNVIIIAPDVRISTMLYESNKADFYSQKFNLQTFSGNMLVFARKKAKSLGDKIKAFKGELPFLAQVTKSADAEGIVEAAKKVLQMLA